MTTVAVIGGGPGGYVAAIRAAQLGAEVTLIEKDAIGGTCLNVGCIPTKALLHTAELLNMAKEAAACGVTIKPKLDFAKAQAHKAQVVAQLVEGVTGLLRLNKVSVLKGQASFVGAKKLSVLAADGSTQTLAFDRIIIATGSQSIVPPLPGMDNPSCIDSTGALSLSTVPKSMLIIGGGVIGVEMASVYVSMGTKITIIEMMEQILPMMDVELTGYLRSILEQDGIQILTGAKVLSAEQKDKLASLQVELDGQIQSFDAEKVLVSVGRRPDTASLNLEAAGVATERGRIIVDAGLRTNVDGVFAIGDCTGGSMLAHVASVHGEIAAENAIGHFATYKADTLPSCVYTTPEFAGVGLNEQQAQAKGLDYVVGRFPLSSNGKTLVTGGQGIIKIIAGGKYGEVLGLSILGPRATDLITEAALAIELEATLDEIIATIHAHPTIGEAVREAAMAAQGRAIHIPNH
jgi:dihydrolipoamide dehydrogenase